MTHIYDSPISLSPERLKADIDRLLEDCDALGESLIACHLQLASDLLAERCADGNRFLDQERQAQPA